MEKMVHTKDKPVYSKLQKYDSSSEDVSFSEGAFPSKDLSEDFSSEDFSSENFSSENFSSENFSSENFSSEIESLQINMKKTEILLKRTKTISAQRLEELKAVKESFSDEKKKMLEEIKQLRSDYESLSADYKTLKTEAASTEDRLNKARSDLIKYHDDLILAREDVVHSQGIIQQIESQKKALEFDKLHFERETKRLRVELDRMKTTPLLMGTVIKMLDNDHVIVRSSAGPQLVVVAPSDLTEKELAPGANVALNQQTFSIAEVLPVLEEPEVSALELIESTDVTYDEIGGLFDQLREIREVVELPLIKPEIFERIGIEPPKGALLYGPPGTGKTMIAKAVANRTNAAFIRVVGSELVQKYIGDGAKMVHELFEMAEKKAPAIIFIDEVDSIASRRTDDTTSADREIHRTLMQLLAEMDGFNHRSNVKIIAATNRLDILDPAILRPGRFDRMVYVPLPDETGRTSIFKIHSSKMTLSPNINFEELSKMTEGASGADIKAIVTEAGMFAVRLEKTFIEKTDFLDAIDKIMDSKKKENLPIPENMFG
jgi:26S proteasome subunit P45 family